MRDTTILCSDGMSIAGTIYEPVSELKAAVLIGPATGIKRRFYHSFATHLSEEGYAVLTFDNRGIGDSGADRLNEVDATLPNWGRLDMTAALDHLMHAYPDTHYHLVGHSAGGQLVGLMDNAHELRSIFNFACSSGSIHYAQYPFKFQSLFFMHIFIPLSNLLFGQVQSQWVGMGEPLPRQVGYDWRRYCTSKGYVAADLGTRITEHHYDTLSVDSMWLHAADDGIANIDTVKDMVRVYAASEAQIVTLHPADEGYKDIGHMKFFSKSRRELWRYATDWLERYS